ncbi:MAG TPA: carbohydrate kinase family protein [Candidatus Dormibacteraeota bacterium]
MSGAIDWLAVGDIAEERGSGTQSAIGGGAGRLVQHAAHLNASIALVGKVGDDPAGRHLRDALTRLRVDLQWLRTAPGMRTTSWTGRDADPQQRRVERGADLGLRLDELPARSVVATLTVVSGYSLSVEPARSAVMGALAQAPARGGRAALLLEAELLWWMNARITRRVLEAGLALADSVVLTAADAAVLFGTMPGRQVIRAVAKLGPRIVYLLQADGSVLVREGARVHRLAGSHPDGARRHATAAAASFWVGLAQRQPVLKAAEASVRYAEGRQPPGAPRRGRPS